LAGRADAVGARALAGCAWCAFELGDDPATLAAIAAAKAHPAVQGELAGLLELESAVAHRRADWALAIAAASAFLQQFPQHEKATALRFSLGTAQLRSGDAAAARTTLQEVLAAGGGARPDRVAYELGWAARQAGDEPAALAAFRRASESPEVELAGEAKLHLGLAALEQKDLTAATAWLSAVQGSQRGRALYRLGFACFEAAGDEVARLQQAREHFAAVVGIDGEALVGEARYMLGECSRRLGDHAGAIAALQPLLQLAPPHPRAERARLVLGECALAIGDDATVVATLQPLLQASLERADAARVQLWLGRARARRGEHEAAEAALAKATELSDGALAAEAQFRLGEGREARGDLRGACDAYVKLPILYADPTWVPAGLLQAGLCYERLQQPDKAQRFFRELVEKHPNHPAAATARQHLRAN
jgi:TolA-binding protein